MKITVSQTCQRELKEFKKVKIVKGGINFAVTDIASHRLRKVHIEIGTGKNIFIFIRSL